MGDDPEGYYIWATVDVDDTNDVVDLVLPLIMDIQNERGLDLYFVPEQPMSRIIEALALSPYFPVRKPE